MNEDKELLELAAKAAGYEEWDWLRGDGLLNVYDADGRHGCWNPLTDDGDALRLAVKLGMNINIPNYVVTCSYKGALIEKHFTLGYGDYEYATRRNIVKCAAEIGRGME